MGSVFKKPKAPQADASLEKQRKAELARSEAERMKQIQEGVASQTARNRGTGRKSLLTKGSSGFSLRSLLGG